MLQRKIMVVDDDMEFLKEVEETLALSGYNVETVNDAAEAFTVAKETKPDVILLDLKMKGMTGFEVANKLKNFGSTNNIPIIAMSGFFTSQEDDTLLSFFRINNYLRKPFNPLDIITKIEDTFRNRNNNQ